MILTSNISPVRSALDILLNVLRHGGVHLSDEVGFKLL